MKSISTLSVQNRLLVLLLAALFVGVGSWQLFQLPVDAFPDTTPVQVQINTVAPALNPEEIEQQITLPVELAMGGLPGLQSVRSVSKFGFSQVVATFSDRTSITDARQYVSERLAAVGLPEGLERPQLGPIATGLGEIFHYTLSSTDTERSLEELRTIHDWVIKPELRKVPGVAEVNSWGGYERQYHVIVAPDALVKFGLSLDQVADALEANNKNVGGGVLNRSGQSLLVHGLGRVSSIEEIENIVVAAYEGAPLRVRDIASEVTIGYEIRRGAVSAQGKGEVVLGLAFMLMGENGQDVTEELKSRLENLKRSLPDDVNVTVVYDRTELTSKVIGTVEHNLAAGAILVVAILFTLLGNLRAGLLVASVIPVSMLFSAFGMSYFGISASLLSLGAVDFGMIVDGSVVMTEANMRKLNKLRQQVGRPLKPSERIQVIIDSAREISRPVIFGMGITIVVFFPILTLEGTEGKMFRPMALTFIFALAGALLYALTVTPVLNYFCLKPGSQSEDNWFSRKLSHAYRLLLKQIMRLRVLFLGAVAVVLAVSLWLGARMGGEFMPRLGEGAIAINTIRLAGISIPESVAYNTRIEQMLLDSYPDEIRYVWSRVGTAEVATDPMGTELTDIFISLNPRKEWTKASSQAELVAAMQETVSVFPGLNMAFTQPIEMRLNEMESGIRSDVGIKIYGDDFDELVRLSDEVQRLLLQIEGQRDISVDQLTGQPTLKVEVNQSAIARHGVSARDVLSLVESIGGIHVGDVFEGQRNFPLILRLPDKMRTDLEALRTTIVSLPSGQKLPLSQLVDIRVEDGSATINREWGRRLIRVQMNVEGRDVSSFVAEAKQQINDNLNLPAGYVIDWGGQFENLERARLRLAIVVPLTLLIVFFMLYFSMKNMRDVLLIYTGIPLALIGGILSIWFRGIPFSVSSAVGFIALSGIAVLNGQILISAIRSYREQTQSIREAVTEAACERLRPVLATALTSAAGFLPMAVSTGVGSEIQRPLATVVVGGILTSTLLTLFILPLLYELLAGKKDSTETSK
ncbi:MAG: efflux RND transporter permease subunit [Coraliomargarita sp.]